MIDIARRIIEVTPDDIEGPGEHRHWSGRTFGAAGMTTDVGSPCYPYKCVWGCSHKPRYSAFAIEEVAQSA